MGLIVLWAALAIGFTSTAPMLRTMEHLANTPVFKEVHRTCQFLPPTRSPCPLSVV